MFKNKYIIGNRTSDFNRIQQLRRFGFSSVRKSGGWRDIRGKTSFLASDRCLFRHEGLPLHMVNAMFRRRVVE